MNFQPGIESSPNSENRFSLSQPYVGAFDIDRTLLYNSPKELAAAVHLVNIFARSQYNFYSTVITQHLCDDPKEHKYDSIARLNWNINGKRVVPPIMLEMGIVAAWPNDAGTKLENHQIINSDHFDFQDYAKNIRPQVMEIIENTFPQMTEFEAGMVLIGAQLNKTAPGKKIMKPQLEAELDRAGLADQVWVMDAGKDLDCVPKILQHQGKMIGTGNLLKILNNDQRYQGLIRPDLNRMILADDKAYAAEAPAKQLMRQGGGVILSAEAETKLNQAIVNEGLRGSFTVAKHSRAMEVVMAAFKLALQKDALTQK